MTLNEELSNAFPGFEPTPDARRASQVAIRERTMAVQRTRHIRRSVAVAAFTIVTTAILVGMGPKALAVYKLSRIEGAVDDAKTAEIDEYTIQPDGSQLQTGRELYDQGRWRMEHGPSVRIWEAGKLWLLDPSLKRVTVQAAPNGPSTYNSSGFSVRSMIADMARWNWGDRIDVGEGTFEGAIVSQVTITSPHSGDRLVVLANKETSMPIAFRMESKTVRGWHLSGLARAKFDLQLDKGLFSTRFDPSLPVVDLDRMRSDFKTRIETPVATYSWKKKTIAIRSVDVNPNGHVFVLFTDGETKADRQREGDEMVSASRKGLRQALSYFRSPHPDVEVTSSLGIDYLKTGNLQPYIAGPTERFCSGIVLRDGELLQGAWFIPAHPTAWQPLTITVKFDGDAAKTYQRQFSTATTPILPDWAPLMGLGPHVDEDVLLQEFDSRRMVLQEGSDVKALIANIEGELALRRQEESKGIGPWDNGDLYMAFYRAYIKQGDHSTALTYLRKAAEESTLNPELEQALKKEGLR